MLPPPFIPPNITRASRTRHAWYWAGWLGVVVCVGALLWVMTSRPLTLRGGVDLFVAALGCAVAFLAGAELSFAARRRTWRTMRQDERYAQGLGFASLIAGAASLGSLIFSN